LEEKRDNPPFVSVVMPVYNGAEYLKEAIQSILDQTFTEFEFIILDDGSTDESRQIIAGFQDPRIRFIQNEKNLGLVATLNVGLNHAAGKYIARMDQDDIALPHRFQQQVDFLQANLDYVMCGTTVHYIGNKDERKFPRSDDQIKVGLIFGCPFAHPTVMIRRSVLETTGLRYDEQYKHAEDYGLWMELAIHGKMINLEEKGLRYRIHDKQYSVTFKEAMAASCANIRKKYMKYLGVEMSEADEKLFDWVTKREISYSDEAAMERVGSFFNRIPDYFEQSSLNMPYLESSIQRQWRILLANREKQGLGSYKLYLNSALAWSVFEPTVHAWFIKQWLKRIMGK
jgi:glycosyltransferase involved in cell wall biosynthesis